MKRFVTTTETYGAEIDGEHYIQIRYPNGKLGAVYYIKPGRRWGWDWWMNQFDPEPIGEFPKDVSIEEAVEANTYKTVGDGT